MMGAFLAVKRPTEINWMDSFNALVPGLNFSVSTP